MRDFNSVINTIHNIKSKQLLGDFLYGITTPAERRELGRRLEIVERLLKQQPQHQISEDLHVGVATVTRGSRELSQGRFKVLRSGSHA